AGCAVALRLSHSSLVTAVRGDSNAAPSGQRLRSIFTVAEVALAVTLLVGAVVMLRSVQQLLAVDPGFATEKRLSMRLALPATSYPKGENVVSFYETLRNRVS